MKKKNEPDESKCPSVAKRPKLNTFQNNDTASRLKQTNIMDFLQSKSKKGPSLKGSQSNVEVMEELEEKNDAEGSQSSFNSPKECTTSINKPLDLEPPQIESTSKLPDFYESSREEDVITVSAVNNDAESCSTSQTSGKDYVVIDMEESDTELSNALSNDHESKSELIEYETDFSKEESFTLTASEPLQERGNDDAQSSRRLFGTPFADLVKTPECAPNLPELQPDQKSHKVLFRPYIRKGEAPRPYPSKYFDVWDSHHVRMPCSEKNLYPLSSDAGVGHRWELIECALVNNITSSYDLEEAVYMYNSHYKHRWNFNAFHSYCRNHLSDEENHEFFNDLFPDLIRLSLKLPLLCTTAPTLLRKMRSQGTAAVTLTQLQCASLLANAFFCTYPRRNSQSPNSEFASFPEINFNRLFESPPAMTMNHRRKHEKLRALLHYFRRVTQHPPTGTVSFIRQRICDTPDWKTSQEKMPRLHIATDGTIEDAEGLLQIDFANKYLGGGTLGSGCVQEEIRFLICPELIISQLIAEELDSNECLIMIGAERYSKYSGYADSFKWQGNFHDRTPRDAWGRRFTEVVAMDALRYTAASKQYSLKCIKRELNKAFVAFTRPEAAKENLSAIATGNWGCGAFGGDPYLKSLIQLMAAAEAGRDVAYFTFGDLELAKDLHAMHSILVEKDVTVSQLWSILEEVATSSQADSEGGRRSPYARRKLFSFIDNWLSEEEGHFGSSEIIRSDNEDEEPYKDMMTSPSQTPPSQTPLFTSEDEDDDDVVPSSVPNQRNPAENLSDNPTPSTSYARNSPVQEFT